MGEAAHDPDLRRARLQRGAALRAAEIGRQSMVHPAQRLIERRQFLVAAAAQQQRLPPRMQEARKGPSQWRPSRP